MDGEKPKRKSSTGTNAARVASIAREAMLDGDHNLNAAFLRINLRTTEVTFHWLPDLFIKPMPQSMREEIASRLRFHADCLESGDLEREMQKFVEVNNPNLTQA
jgi:hypothetical protein